MYVRIQFACIKCGCCYSCYWKKEEPKKVESEESIKINSAVLDKYPQSVSITVEQSLSSSQQQIMAMDLHSQQIEPICNYSTCNPKFSERGHDNHKCKCHNDINYATRATISLLTWEVL